MVVINRTTTSKAELQGKISANRNKSSTGLYISETILPEVAKLLNKGDRKSFYTELDFM